jgi:hypothetical protein
MGGGLDPDLDLWHDRRAWTGGCHCANKWIPS